MFQLVSGIRNHWARNVPNRKLDGINILICHKPKLELQNNRMLPANCTLTNINQTRSNSLVNSFIAPSISIHSSSHQIYDSFQFKDHVTFQKTKFRNLHRLSEDEESKLRKKNGKPVWSGETYDQEKEEKIKMLQNLMAYIQQIKNIRNNRNNELVVNWKNRKFRFTGHKCKEAGQIGLRRSMDSVQTQTELQKTLHLRNSIDEKIARERKMVKRMRRELLQMSVQQFRKYYRKEQVFNKKNQNLLNLAEDLRRGLNGDWRQGKEKEQKKDGGIRVKTDKEAKDKIGLECDRKFEVENAQLTRLLRMRLVQETHYNWGRH